MPSLWLKQDLCPGSGTALMSPECHHTVPESGAALLGQGRLLCSAGSAPSVPLQAKESWEMDTKEKLEQAAVVKEKGTMYFKVCQRWGGRGGELGLNLAAISVREALCPQMGLGKASPALPLPFSHPLILPEISHPFPALPWLCVLPAEQNRTADQTLPRPGPLLRGFAFPFPKSQKGLCIPFPSWGIPAPHVLTQLFPNLLLL